MAKESTFITALKEVFNDPPIRIQELQALTTEDRIYFL